MDDGLGFCIFGAPLILGIILLAVGAAHSSVAHTSAIFKAGVGVLAAQGLGLVAIMFAGLALLCWDKVIKTKLIEDTKDPKAPDGSDAAAAYANRTFNPASSDVGTAITDGHL